jgi:DSF synthase
MALAKREIHPVTHGEMRAIVDIWVDAAMRLETRDLRMMARLVKAQDRMQVTSGELADEAADEALVANC